MSLRRLPLFLTLVLAAIGCGGSEGRRSGTIEPSSLAKRIERGTAPVVLDVRTPDEFAAGHIPGAINIPLSDLGDRTESLGLAASDEIVVHCERGPRAEAAAAILREAGYTRIRDLKGHMRAWRDAGRPIESGRE